MDKETRFFRGVINALTWLIVGMTFSSWLYCNKLGITSGSMYIGTDTVLVVLGGLAGIHLLKWIDPAFRER